VASEGTTDCVSPEATPAERAHCIRAGKRDQACAERHSHVCSLAGCNGTGVPGAGAAALASRATDGESELPRLPDGAAKWSAAGRRSGAARSHPVLLCCGSLRHLKEWIGFADEVVADERVDGVPPPIVVDDRQVPSFVGSVPGMTTGHIDLSELLQGMADRAAHLTEANVQSDLRTFLLAAPLELEENDLEIILEIILEQQAGRRRGTNAYHLSASL